MLCESCNEREATVHLTQVIDGSVKKIHLCEECAAKGGFDVHGPISVTDILLGMGTAAGEETERTCSRCHMRRTDFKKTGRLGCAACYEAFESELGPLIKAMHRSEQHKGKIPAGEGVRVRMTAEITDLQEQLDKAIAAENYEEAAKLRDRIQECRSKASDSEKKRKKKP